MTNLFRMRFTSCKLDINIIIFQETDLPDLYIHVLVGNTIHHLSIKELYKMKYLISDKLNINGQCITEISKSLHEYIS